MAAWAGFSEEDLRQVKNIANPNNNKSRKKVPENVKKATFGLEKSERPSQRYSASTSNTQQTEINPLMKLQKQPKDITSSHKIPKERKEENTTECSEGEKSTTDVTCNVVDKTETPELEELDDKHALERDMKSLECFRTQQKAIEEANKQKKALLAKTLLERRQRAKKETFKLEHIQKELSKLDNLLTADVTVIRGKIEEASRDYLDAQRRFEKAEAEYVASKMDLHSKSELKEHLTEHLYTIIHQNEMRKAKKLADLMKELEMDNSDEEFYLPELPPLASFQPATSLSPTGLNPGLNRSKSHDSNHDNQTVSQVEDKPKLTMSQPSPTDTHPNVKDSVSDTTEVTDTSGVESSPTGASIVTQQAGLSANTADEIKPEEAHTEKSSHEHDNEISSDNKCSVCEGKETVSESIVNIGNTTVNTLESKTVDLLPTTWVFSPDKS